MAAKLGIIAGGGDLPARLVEVCHASGRAVFVLAFEGQTDPATVLGVDHAWVRLGQVRPGLEALHGAEVEELVLIGPVKRPSLNEIGFDLRGAQFMAKIAAQGLGDDVTRSADSRARLAIFSKKDFFFLTFFELACFIFCLPVCGSWFPQA